MDPAKGYRLKVSGVADLSRVLGGFRTEATRLLARRYGTLVAREAAWTLDRWKLGLCERPDDFIAAACSSVRRRLASDGPLACPDLNCVIAVHFVRDAVLAGFLHGHDGYLRAWESVREVVAWGWSEDGRRPRGVSEAAWEARGRYWKAAAAGPPFGRGLRFTLVEDGLPDLGWGAVRRYLPSWDERVGRAAAALAGNGDADEARRQAERALARDIVRDSLLPAQGRPLSAAGRRPSAARPVRPPPESAGGRGGEAGKPPAAPEDEGTGAERIRAEARKARKERFGAARGSGGDPGRASSIDHADVVVASDGRVFVAAPYVGFDPENRVFVQVGDDHVAFSQGGVQYGHVTDVPRSAIDLLRTCRTVILVEVARGRDGEGRLLRARHVAIVSDIGLSDSLGISLGGYRRQANARGEKEIREWDSRQ